MDRTALELAEKRLADIQNEVGYSTQATVSAQTFLRLCDLLRDVLWAVQRETENAEALGVISEYVEVE